VLHIVESGSSFWPTPTASDAKRMKEFSAFSLVKSWASREPGARYLAEVLAGEYGLFQTPHLTEWLMGFPIGWTDCAAPATPSSPRLLSGSDDES
jgi:hypothetical protein